MKNAVVTKKNLSLILILALWLTVIVLVVFYTLMSTVYASERLTPVYSVKTDKKELALTFNCAWDDSFLDDVLTVLEGEDICCTFFFVGEFCEKYPDAVRRVYNSGHEIGNHSMHHTDPVTLEADKIISDMRQCNEILASLTGTAPSLYRPPSGSYDNKTVEAAAALEMTAVQWDVDSIDWKGISAEKMTERITGKVRNGSIVLFHIGKENTRDALQGIIRQLKNEGYSFVTVGDMLIKDEYYIDNSGRQIKLEKENGTEHSAP